MEGKSGSPQNLPDVSEKYEPLHILRKKDIIDLFDTSSDLTGFDVDVSRFIREANDRDLYAFWRSIPNSGPPDSNEPSPHKDEICSIPIGDLKEWNCWKWDHLEDRWVYADSLAPGMTIMLRLEDGGYSSDTGWTGNSKDIPSPLQVPIDIPEEGNDDDPLSNYYNLSLTEHTLNVIKEVEELLTSFPELPLQIKKDIKEAALWHDFGKGHPVCQEAFNNSISEEAKNTILAKTDSRKIEYSRRGFRHELASGIAMMQNKCSSLSSYLAASHHGKIRLSIRSLPNETRPPERFLRFARGIWDGDILPSLEIPGIGILPETMIDLSLMECGETKNGLSWLGSMLELRTSPMIGLFGWVFYEAHLRGYDWKASKKERGKNDE